MRGNLLAGIAIGAAAALFGPLAWRSGRPAVKKVVRAGMEGYVHARVAAARVAEEIEDIVAEVGHEMQEIVAEAAAAGEHVIHGKGKAND